MSSRKRNAACAGGRTPRTPPGAGALPYSIYIFIFFIECISFRRAAMSCDFFCLQHHIMSRSTSTYVLQSTVHAKFEKTKRHDFHDFVIFFATNTFELVNWPMGSNLKRPCDIRLQIENGSWKIVCGAQRDTHQSGQRAKVRSFGGAQRRAQNHNFA